MSITSRLEEYIRYKEISLNRFDASIGVSSGYTGKMIRNKASIGSDVLERIFKAYSDLNIPWLFTGIGSMILNNSIDEKDSIIIDQAKIIADLRKEIMKLKGSKRKE